MLACLLIIRNTNLARLVQDTLHSIFPWHALDSDTKLLCTCPWNKWRAVFHYFRMCTLCIHHSATFRQVCSTNRFWNLDIKPRLRYLEKLQQFCLSIRENFDWKVISLENSCTFAFLAHRTALSLLSNWPLAVRNLTFTGLHCTGYPSVSTTFTKSAVIWSPGLTQKVQLSRFLFLAYTTLFGLVDRN